MQAAPYAHSYHQLHQAQQALATAADHELKRRYLSLLPSPQVIEICLNFDFHVPLYVKASIWPMDISGAITALQNSQQTPSTDASKNEEKKDEEPVMDSLSDPTDDTSSSHGFNEDKETSTPNQSTSSAEPASTSAAGPSTQPSAPNPIAAPVPVSAPTATAASTVLNPPATTPTPAPTPQHPLPTLTPTPQHPLPVPAPTPQHPLPTPAIAYPRYAYPAQPAYPHAPYYSAQHAWPPYMHYPPHPHATAYHTPPPPSVTGYQPPPPPPPPPPPAPPAVTLASQQAQAQESANIDDLPSYEDMIVEALSDGVEDPEGLAPKDLYTWVASHYPVQSNFRPSASQALQKAYRRGRFEKSSSGKYRLNPEWKGGTTTRRTTRRPQTLTTSTSAPSPQTRPPPFTKTPLIQRPGQSVFASKQPFAYSYQSGRQPQTGVASQTSSNAEVSSSNVQEESGELGDAYEAAQHILKAINFGALLKMDTDDDAVLSDQPSPSGPEAPSETAPVDGHHSSVGSKTVASKRPVAHAPGDDNDAEHSIRAELQAQLALLAAQLSEMAQEMSVSQAVPWEAPSDVPSIEVHAESQELPQELSQPVQTDEDPERTPEIIPLTGVEDSDDEEMDEVVC
ncbi:hypothetical protein VKT23_005863 [Stygiomarasmius scandens]|uniref:Histone H1 n=1 Tax=Marasmiellus scandens TaxID=2682957 RepID=A0ABR1JU99_9AGAR